MPEPREVFEMVTKQTEPDVDAWKQQERRQRNANRNRKIGAIAVAAVLVGTLVVLGIGALGSDEVKPAGSGPNPTLGPEGTERQTLSIVDVGSGAETTTLTVPANALDFDLMFDGSMVAYADLDKQGNAQLFAMDADGSNVRQLTHGEGSLLASGLPGAGTHAGLDWSPDGSMIAYQWDTPDGPPQIFTVRVSDGVATRVTNEPDGAVDPGGWAPDGGSIVFASPDLSINHYSALSLDLATGQTTLLVPDGSTPKLSPDGSRIAFNSWFTARIRLIVANGDGSERRVIARFDGDDGYQEWSPDGTKLAFVADIDENGFGTHVYDLVTGRTRFVTSGSIESWVDNDHILVS